MALSPDPDSPLEPEPVASDRNLWIALAMGSAVIAGLALAVHLFLPPSINTPGAGKPSPAPFKETPPLMSRPQLLESQQAMPELAGFDAQNPPPDPISGGGSLSTPGAPSSPGTGGLAQ